MGHKFHPTLLAQGIALGFRLVFMDLRVSHKRFPLGSNF